jgi:hypothetical protein
MRTRRVGGSKGQTACMLGMERGTQTDGWLGEAGRPSLHRFAHACTRSGEAADQLRSTSKHAFSRCKQAARPLHYLVLNLIGLPPRGRLLQRQGGLLAWQCIASRGGASLTGSSDQHHLRRRAAFILMPPTLLEPYAAKENASITANQRAPVFACDA